MFEDGLETVAYRRSDLEDVLKDKWMADAKQLYLQWLGKFTNN